MQRIDINTIRERCGTVDTDHFEKRRAKEELERNFYEFMELEEERGGERVPGLQADLQQIHLEIFIKTMPGGTLSGV